MSVLVRRVEPDDFKTSLHPFQSVFWAKAKSENSWQSHFFSVDADDNSSFDLLVLSRPFCHGAFTLCYVPMGPPVRYHLCLSQLSKALVSQLPKSTFAIRYDLPFDYSDELGFLNMDEDSLESWFADFAATQGLRMLDESIQPQGTVFNDLSSESMYRRRALSILKKNKSIVDVGFWNKQQKEFDDWYDIYLRTAEKDHFNSRSKNYISSLLNCPKTGGVECSLILARVDGVIKGGIVIIRSPEIEVNLFGAAIRDPAFNVSYCIQDFALRDAIENHVKYYDFYGSHGSRQRGENLNSLSMFKLAFGGKQIYRIPSVDFVIKPLVWSTFRALENRRLSNARGC